MFCSLFGTLAAIILHRYFGSIGPVILMLIPTIVTIGYTVKSVYELKESNMEKIMKQKGINLCVIVNFARLAIYGVTLIAILFLFKLDEIYIQFVAIFVAFCASYLLLEFVENLGKKYIDNDLSF